MTALVALFLPASAEAQSFNCRYARFADEVTICQEPRLSRLDERMSQLFYELRNDIGGARLDAEQDAWLWSRRSCGRDPACIESAYRERIRELRR
jgi:uncharacterized protein